jgi:hypothetical protein
MNKPGIYKKDGFIIQVFKDGTVVSMRINEFLDTVDVLDIASVDKDHLEITFKVKDEQSLST